MEYLDVVNEKDEVVGKASREEVYSKKLTHRIVHILLLSEDRKRVYLQKRSKDVSYLPGHYCTSAGGHVLVGESYEEAAKRELKEELGVQSSLNKIAKFEFMLDGQNRFITLFTTYTDAPMNFSDGEVESGSFYSLEEAQDIISKGKSMHPQLKPCFDRLISSGFLE